MREVRREYKARQKAERQKAKAAEDYWRQETGKGPRPQRSKELAAGLAVCVALTGVVLGAMYLLKAGPFAGPGTAVAAPGASTSASPQPTGSGKPSPSSSEGSSRTAIMEALAPPGSCLEVLEINPRGGRHLVTGSCDVKHAAEVISLTDGSEIWKKYPSEKQRDRFDLQCVATGMMFLGWPGGSDAELKAFVDRVQRKGIAIQAAFPSRNSWKKDAAVLCVIGLQDRMSPPGSMRGSMLS